MIAVSTAMKTKNDHSLIRSARAPETIEAVVATNTIWKNQPDMAAWPVSTTAAPSPPPSSATSSAEVSKRNSREPNQPPGSTPTYMML